MFHTTHGVKLQLGGVGESPTFVDIPYLRNIPGIEEEQEQIETTTHSNSGYKTYIPSGLIDPGEYEFEMQTDRENEVHLQLFAMRKSGAIETFRLIYPDGLAQEFDAAVASIVRGEADAQSPDVIVDRVKLAIAGEVRDISDELLG